MNKKQYVQPITEFATLKAEKLLIIASPGIGSDYNPDDPIDSKEGGFWDSEDELFKKSNLWDD